MDVIIASAFENALADLITKYMNQDIDADRLAATMEIQVTALRERSGVFLRVTYLSRNNLVGT